MKLDRVVAEPPPPGRVIRTTRRDEPPEARPVPEVAQMRELVDDDRLERFRRGEDQAPRKGQAAIAGRAPPPRPRVAERDRGRLGPERRSVDRDVALDRGPRTRAQPVLEPRRHGTAVRPRYADHELVA